ncbi:hypothetical protein ACN94_21480 [Gordonia paraffinivorans]|uniref:hypothetical protein n=1 Tax=Gordonia paraffinivorans TaxID=175628 RepID=UPI001C930593|nr:hypothetical protein [Gordonia paraffinivorans]MBY4576102.1 hypothetical protein [Gordonia paraffinivorans]MBY4576108.1 hypothetical protein [Gordonia paraffinivorans]
MQYISSNPSPAASGTVAAILWLAADAVALIPEVSDPIHLAAEPLIAAGLSTERHYRTAVTIATLVAASRHPHLADTCGDSSWEPWQQELTEPWPILADAANYAAQLGQLQGQITPGRWIA